MDHYATTRRTSIRRFQNWLKRHKRFHSHFIPTSRVWLNVIERWFRDITHNRIRNGVFQSVQQLEPAIRNYIDHHNANPKTFVWTKKAEEFLAKVTRTRAALSELPSA
jgi:hypothetical protein